MLYGISVHSKVDNAILVARITVCISGTADENGKFCIYEPATMAELQALALSPAGKVERQHLI